VGGACTRRKGEEVVEVGLVVSCSVSPTASAAPPTRRLCEAGLLQGAMGGACVYQEAVKVSVTLTR
jgi:hypothetical protein